MIYFGCIYGSRKIFIVDSIYGGEVRPRKIGTAQNNVPSIIEIMPIISLNITKSTFILGLEYLKTKLA